MEMLYQYLWKHGMVGEKIAGHRGRRIPTVDGASVTVLYPGIHNRDAGPDFMGARISMDHSEWAGNVEIHVKASDWYRHNHQTDPAYNSVILHAVGVNDQRVATSDGRQLPQVVITCPESFASLYLRLAENISQVKCQPMLGEISPLSVTDWVSTLEVERMQQKAERVMQLTRFTGGDWEWTCFIMLARALGFGLNSEPFEILARSVPLTTLLHHSDDLLQLEALLFGQAGMLDTSIHIFDDYYQQICREYFFLARKYGLRPMRRDLWKYARTRPQNFPHRRVAMLAAAVEGGFRLMSDILDAGADIDRQLALLDWHLSDYWSTHADFDTDASPNAASLVRASRNLLLINFTAPLLYAYGDSRGNPDLTEAALGIWEQLGAEANSIVRQWKSSGIPCDTAAESQALLQLRKEYCDRNRCMDCRFGHTLLRNTIFRPE